MIPCKSDHLSSPKGTQKPDPNRIPDKAEGESYVQRKVETKLHDVYANVELPGNIMARRIDVLSSPCQSA